MVGPAPAPFATPGVVGVGVMADSIGIRPATPPKAPAGFEAGVATGALTVLGRTSVLVSELARTGGAANDDDVTESPTAELSDTGAPTMGTAVGLAAAGGAWEDGRGVSEVEDVESESPGGGTSPGWFAPPWLGSGVRDELVPAGSEDAAAGGSEGAAAGGFAGGLAGGLAGGVAAGGFPTSLVLRASSGTGITVTPMPPVATTTGGAAPEPAPPAGAADADPPPAPPSTAPLARPGQTVTVEAAAVTVTVTAVAFATWPAPPPPPTVIVCCTVSVTVWAPAPRRFNMLMKPSARFTVLAGAS